MSKPSEDVSEVLCGQRLSLDHSAVASRSVVLFLKEKKKNPRPMNDMSAFRGTSDFVKILVLYFIISWDFLLPIFSQTVCTSHCIAV